MTLDPDLHDKALALLHHIPGATFSGFMGDLVLEFVERFGPVVEQAMNGADPATQIELFKKFHGESTTDLALEFSDLIRTLERLEQKSSAAN
jgi:hypothetical protein